MTKKIVLFVLFLGLGISLASAQNLNSGDSSAIRELYKMVADLKKNQSEVARLIKQHREDSLRIAELNDQMRTQKEVLTGQEVLIKNVQVKMELDDKKRYALIYNNLIISTELNELIYERLNTLYTLSQSDNYRNSIAALNNPADESLGFSYNQKVNELLQKYVTNGNNKDNPRIKDFVGTLLKNPVVSTLTAANPVLSMGASVLSFVAGVAANRKDINPQQMESFKMELDQFTMFYARMNTVNASYGANMQEFQIETNSLYNKLGDIVVRNARASQMQVKMPVSEDVPARDYLTDVFVGYNRESIKAYLKGLDKKHQVNGKSDYASLLSNNKHLSEMDKRSTDVIDLFKEFVFLYNRYISLLDENSKSTISILEEAKNRNLSNDNAKVQQQINSLTNQKTEVIRSIKRSMNIDKLINLAEKLNTLPEGN